MTRSYDISLEDVCTMPLGTEKAIQLAVYGLCTNGAHHKQWYFEQILLALGVDLNNLRNWLDTEGYAEPEKGIAP